MIACDVITEFFPDKREVEEREIEFLDGYSNDLKELVYKMLTIDPSQRPTI